MKVGDRILQRWRIAKARPYIASGSRVLDIGCSDGMLFVQLKPLIGEGVGIDPSLSEARDLGYYRLVPGWFPDDLPDKKPFDVITMLAVLEHIPKQEQMCLATSCSELLRGGGHLIITVPSPTVDQLLRYLKYARLVDGMKLEEHYGFDSSSTPLIFASEKLKLVRADRFQFGLNNLFVFQKQF